MRMTERTNNANTSTRSRAPAIWVFPNAHRLHFRISTVSSANQGIDSPHIFKIGHTYHVTYLVDSNRVTLMVDGKIISSVMVGNVYEVNDAVVFVSDYHYWGSAAEVGSFEFRNNEVLYPGRDLCKQNPAGIFGRNVWNKPV